MIDFLCVGEALAVGRVPPDGLTASLTLGAGGAELNVAVALAHAGWSVRFASRLGSDPFGAFIEDFLRASKVDAHIESDSARTGFYLRTEQIAGRDVYYYRDGSAGSRLPADETLHSVIVGSRHLHLTGITAALRPENAAAIVGLIDFARASGCVVSFDVNYRARLWEREVASTVLRRLAVRADLVLVGADEAEELWGTADVRALRRILPVEQLVLKNSDARVVDVVTPMDSHHVKVPDVTVVDSVGAGDAFAAGYLHGVRTGAGVAERVAFGHAFATEVLRSSSDVLDHDAVQRALNSTEADRNR